MGSIPRGDVPVISPGLPGFGQSGIPVKNRFEAVFFEGGGKWNMGRGLAFYGKSQEILEIKVY